MKMGNALTVKKYTGKGNKIVKGRKISTFKTMNAQVMKEYQLYEEGKLTDNEVIRLFQNVLDNNMMWTLSPDHQLIVMHLAVKGHLKLPESIE